MFMQWLEFRGSRNVVEVEDVLNVTTGSDVWSTISATATRSLTSVTYDVPTCCREKTVVCKYSDLRRRCT